jgi:hypothetical protein
MTPDDFPIINAAAYDSGYYWLKVYGPDGIDSMLARWNDRFRLFTIYDDANTAWPYEEATGMIHKWRLLAMEPVRQPSWEPS